MSGLNLGLGLPLSSGAPGGGSGVPDVANLALWLNAQDIPAMSEGATVATWPDLSGNARDGTASGTPIYRANMQGGKAGVEFITAGRKFLTPSFLDSSFDAAFSIYVVRKGLPAALSVWASNGAGATLYCGNNATMELAATGGLSDASMSLNNTAAGACVVSLRYGGASKKMEVFWDNSIWQGVIESATGSLGLSGALTIGDYSAGGFTWIDEIGTVLVYKANVSDPNHISLCNYLLDYYSIPKPFNIFCDGNSMTLGIGVTTPYPLALGSLLGSSYVVTNKGVDANTTADRTTAAPAAIDIYYDPLRPKIAVLWEITNDLFFGGTAGDAYSRYVTWCQGRQSAGFSVVAVTVLPRNVAASPPTFEADRQTINTNIRANWATFADALADVAADNRIGDAGDETDVTYYSDLTHMTNAGYAIVAQIVATAIGTL